MNAQQLSREKLAISLLVRDWFYTITMQRDAGELLEMLASDFELVFPEATLTNTSAFTLWYSGVREQFFNQQHLIRHLDIELESDTCAYLNVWVNWQANQRDANKSTSTQLDFDALQLWQVVKAQDQWRIARYQVVELKSNQENNA